MIRLAVAAVFLLACATVATSSAPAPPVTYDAPAGQLQAGPLAGGDVFAQILPNGRLIRPTGTSVTVGMNSLGFALSPDGRYAIVSNDDEREGSATPLPGGPSGGYSLTVVDTSTMRIVDQYVNKAEAFFVGVVAMRDPANASNTLVLASGGAKNVVYAFDLAADGKLSPDATHTIALPAPSDARYANAGHVFPASIVLAPSHAHAYVVNNLANTVVSIDTRTRAVAGGPVDVGFFPLAAAFSKFGLIVANQGLAQYASLPAPAGAPPFAAPPEDLARASSLSLVTIDNTGAAARLRASVAMDRKTDGIAVVGGAQPDAIAVMKKAPYAFVAMAGVDRVATVALGGVTPRVVGGTELRLFDKGPYGTQPAALALAETRHRLYVALAGINAVAVLDVTDPRRPHRLGLIPTGWYPTALMLSGDGKSLFVANAKGRNHDPDFHGGPPFRQTTPNGRIYQAVQDSNVVWATLEKVDLGTLDLRRSTAAALSYVRTIHPKAADGVVPQAFGTAGSPIKHIVLILEENKTFDAMLGDLADANGAPYGPGDPALVSFDKSVTPNLHALATTFGLAGNFYADAEESDAGHQFVSAGITSIFSERSLLVKGGRYPLINKNEDAEDYPRAGYIFNSLAAAHRSFRDYGDYIRVNGYDEGTSRDPRGSESGLGDPKVDDPNFAGPNDENAPTAGLGGLYYLDAPAPLALAGHVDLNYPGWNLRIRDVRRAREFIRDFDPLVRADTMPDFTHIWLPADHGGAGSNIPVLPEEVADGDRALGSIVEYLTHIPQWSSTLIVIAPDDAQSSRDHVNEHRSYAILVSPYAKRHYLGMRHLSTVSILKTEEEILGLPALSLGDLLATDMADFFTPTADATPYTHLNVPTQTASTEGRHIAALLERTDQSHADADASRSAALIELSRNSDKLAAKRGAYAPADYRARQAALYAQALAVVR